ncbi:MAG: aspartate/glutamate racemase family protein, partial [Aeromonadaceae bacterium]
MKTIGLLGGMSWESTVPYYQHINQLVRERLGGLHSAKVVLYSVDFHEIAQLQRAGNWDEAQAVLAGAAKALAAAGAEILVICTNTMHKLAAQIEAAAGIPLLHIAMPTATAIQQAGLRKVGLMGTSFTMEQPFYRELLQEQYGLELVIPEEAERADIHRVIFEELCVGVVRDESRQRY